MSESISNGDLLRVLLDIKQDVGTIKQSSADNSRRLSEHSEKHEAIEKNLVLLNTQASEQRGALRTARWMAAGVGAVAGFLAPFFHGK